MSVGVCWIFTLLGRDQRITFTKKEGGAGKTRDITTGLRDMHA